MAYPASLDVFPVPAATLAGPPTHESIELAQNTALAAIEKELGVDPAGEAVNVASRLNANDAVVNGHASTLANLGVWKSYSPSLAGLTGSAIGEYALVGGLCHVMVKASPTARTSGAWAVGLPITARPAWRDFYTGNWGAFDDVSAGVLHLGQIKVEGSGGVVTFWIDKAPTRSCWWDSAPATPAAGDLLQFSLVYPI